MVKPFEIEGLVAELKLKGLDLAEEGAKIAAEAVLNWVEESVKMTENKFDDFFMVVKPMLLPELMKQIDKIDQVEG